MQPYLFPHLAYYQLLEASDVFVSYDDVQFIPRGYIHRNTLASGKFTVPLAKGSSRAMINERTIQPELYPKFYRKFYAGWRQRYGKAPYFGAADDLLRRVLEQPAGDVATLAGKSVRLVGEYLGTETDWKLSSELDYDRSASGQDRMLSLLRSIGTEHYVNAIGGQELYDDETFYDAGVGLRFLRPDPALIATEPGLRHSVLHVLAHHPPGLIREWLKQYTLIQKTTV